MVFYYVNGSYQGFFKSKRSLKHGEPLFPYLFILVEDILSHMLHKVFGDGYIGKIFYPRGCPQVTTHLLYADDFLVFTNRKRKTLKKLLNIIEIYESWLCQDINKAKLALYFSNQISPLRRRGLLQLIGFSKEHFPFMYLGAPIISGA